MDRGSNGPLYHDCDPAKDRGQVLMEYIHTGLLNSIWASVLLGVVVAACHRVGSCALQPFFSEKKADGPELAIFGIGAGLAAFASIIWVLGSLGFLSPAVLWTVLVVFFSVPFFVSSGNKAGERLNLLGEGKPAFFMMFLTAPVFFLSWLQAVSPPIGNDALAYHLSHPKFFIENGRIGYIHHARESLWPYLTEMLYMGGLILQGASLAKLFHWLYFILTAAALYVLGRRFFNDKAARWSVLAFLYTPAAFAQAGYAYVDHSFAFYVLLTVYSYFLVRRLGGSRSAALCGLFCGAALSVKFLALGLWAIWAVLWLLTSKRLKEPLLFLAASVLVCGGWYARSWILLGNPVYPFFHTYFGGYGYATTIGQAVGMGKDVLSFILLLPRMTLFPGPFGGEVLGPFYLIFLPFLPWTVKGSRSECRWLAVLILLYMLFLFTQSQQVRFYLSIVPVLALGVGVAVDFLIKIEGFIKKLVLLTMSILLVLHGGIYVYHARDAWDSWTGKASAKVYLENHERSFRGYMYLKENAKPADKVFIASEPRSFYRGTSEPVYYTDALKKEMRLKNESLDTFLDKKGFEYIWLLEGAEPGLEAYLRDRPYHKAFSYHFEEGGVIFRHVIYKKGGS